MIQITQNYPKLPNITQKGSELPKISQFPLPDKSFFIRQSSENLSDDFSDDYVTLEKLSND